MLQLPKVKIYEKFLRVKRLNIALKLFYYLNIH